jgi:replication factor A1
MDNGSFSEIQLNFTNIVDIPNLSPDSIIDILGYVIDIGEFRNITTKRGETYIRRIEIGDSSGFKVELTLWGKFAENSVELKKIYAFQNVKTNEFNGSKRIGTIESTRIIEQLNNYQNEVDILYNYINENNGEFKEIISDKSTISSNYINSDFHLLNEIESDDNLIDKSLRVKAYVTNINHTDKNFYPGCPSCKKKVTQDNENWFCQNCNKHLETP